MEKRLALALILCLAYVFFVVPLISPKGPEKPELEDATESSASDSGPSTLKGADPPLKAPTAGNSKDEPESGEATNDSGFPRTKEDAQEIQIDTKRMRIHLTNSGASISRVLLKEYFNRVGIHAEDPEAKDPANWLEVVSEIQSGIRLGTIRENLSATARPIKDLDNTPWKVESQDARSVVFSFEDGKGFRFWKSYRFHTDELYCDLDFSVENLGAEARSGLADYLIRSGAGIFAEAKTAFATEPRVAAGIRETDEVDVEMIPIEDVEDGGIQTIHGGSNQILWSGSINNYFAVIASPRNEGRFLDVVATGLVSDRTYEAAVEEHQVKFGRMPSVIEQENLRNGARTAVGCEASFRLEIPQKDSRVSQMFKVFTGPKAPTLMDQTEYAEFQPLIEANYTFGTIERTLLSVLRFFESLTGNWGVAIILLTILVRSILFPLQRIQSKAMTKYQSAMKKIKPRLDEVQKKHKNNMRKLREEQMKLMRESGAKPPFLGCLIMLLPLPVFIGLFVSLRTSFDLRHAPFMGWIHDLSQPDQLFELPFKIPILPGGNYINLLPILMTVAWVTQHAVTPVPEEPQAQQMHKMMKWMPIIFGFMLYNYASGLSLYMLTSAILGIVQYKFLNIKTPTM